jgi:predicted MPP superfamily phosphohydrolase
VYTGGDHAPDLDRALRGRDAGRALVLLAHQPRQIALARGRGVGLQLSGHTHGGQLWPFGELVALYQPFVAGFHRAEDGTQIYVSRGTGFWGPPMRVGNPPEIASIVLTS